MSEVKTIADLKLDVILMGNPTFDAFVSKQVKQIALYEDLYKNANRKVKNGIHTIIIPLVDTTDDIKCKYISEKIEIESKNYNLDYFIYLIYVGISKKLNEYNDWHIFLEGFKRINDFEYEAILGS